MRRKAGGYIIQIYATDHPPLHAHLFRDGELVGRYDLEHGQFLKGTNKRHCGRMLNALRAAGLIE